MRTSQATSIRKPLEQAIKAINDSLEREKKSQESSAEFERRAAMPGGTAPATKVKRPTKKKYEQDVTAMLGPAPRNNPAEKNEEGIETNPGINYEKAIKNYRARKKALLRPHITRPRIAKYYPWRHCVAEAARHLTGCGWTTEAEAIYRELDDLPKDNWPIDWSQPGALEEIRSKVFEVAESIRDILMDCLREMLSKKHFTELSELSTSVQRLTVGCGRIWKAYKESQVKVERRGKDWQPKMSEAHPRACELKPSLTLKDFKHYAKEGLKPNGRFKEWVHGSKGKKIPIEKFFE